MKNYKIAVAGTGYVGLSIATLLSQHHKVTAVDIVPEKVEMINNRKSPIQDDYIEKYAKSFTEEEITYIVKKAARKLLKNAVPRLEKVLNDDYVERDRSTYKGQLADIDKAIDADLEEIEHIKAACLNNKTMNASEIARQKQTILDLRKKLRKNKREYKSISAKLDHLENYWEELEPDFELRAKALQWLQSLPQGRTRTRKFLLGATDMYFKALFLDITIHSKSKYTIHWFDDVYTKVILRNTGGNITHA